MKRLADTEAFRETQDEAARESIEFVAGCLQGLANNQLTDRWRNGEEREDVRRFVLDLADQLLKVNGR